MYTNIITTDELAATLDNKNLLLVDCRFELADPESGEYMYLQDHLPGAYFCDLNKDMATKITPTTGRHPLPNINNFQRLLSNWGVTPDTQIVIYDAEGGAMAAARLWWMLKICGHQAIAILDGGYPKWILEDRPVEKKTPPARKPVQNNYQFNPDLYVSTQEIERIHSDPNWIIIDARSSQRFLGLEDMIDRIAGHIPGAVNLPYAELIEVPGKLLPKEGLSTKLSKVLGKYRPDQAVVYCGSGVTSILLVVALEYVGLPGAKVYPGSWSEWIRETRHQISAGVHP